MLRCLLTSFAFASLVFASVQLTGCVIVVDSESEFDCDVEHHEDRTQRIGLDIDHVDGALAGQLNIDGGRATVVRAVHAGSMAARAGMQEFDVITKIDGSDDASPAAVQSAIRAKQPGETVTLSIIRNAQPMEVKVTIDPPAGAHTPA